MHWRSREAREAVREEREHEYTLPTVHAVPRREKTRCRERQRNTYKICPEQNTSEPPRLVRDAAEDEAAEEPADLRYCEHDANLRNVQAASSQEEWREF